MLGCSPRRQEWKNEWNSWNLNVTVAGGGTVTIDPDGFLETAVCPGLCDRMFEIDVTENVTLTAAASSGWDFDHWEDAGSDYHPCAFPTSLPTSVATIVVNPPAEDRDHEERPNVECRAIFVQAIVSSSHAFQMDGPASASIYDTAVDDTTGSVTEFGDSNAAVPANVVDGFLLSSPGGAAAFGPSSPTGRKVVMPGVQPNAGAPAGGGAMAIVGATFNPSGPWAGKLGADGALAWQVHLGATVDDAFEVAAVNADEFLVFGRLIADSTQFIAVLGSGGVVTSVNRLDSTAFPLEIVAASAGGYTVVSSLFLNPARDSFVVRVAGAGTIAWQKSFTGGFVEVTGSAETADGGMFVFGRSGATGATATGWIARLDGTGAVQWQKSYGDSIAVVRITGVVARASDAVAFGRDSTGAAIAMTLDGLGDITSLRSYADSGAAASPWNGGGAAPGGGVALGAVRAAAGEYLAVRTAPDLSLSGCGDASLGAEVSIAAIPVSTATVAVADGTFVLSTLPAFTTTVTAFTTDVSAIPAVDLCTN